MSRCPLTHFRWRRFGCFHTIASSIRVMDADGASLLLLLLLSSCCCCSLPSHAHLAKQEFKSFFSCFLWQFKVFFAAWQVANIKCSKTVVSCSNREGDAPLPLLHIWIVLHFGELSLRTSHREGKVLIYVAKRERKREKSAATAVAFNVFSFGQGKGIPGSVTG